MQTEIVQLVQVKTLEQLAVAAIDRKSVIIPDSFIYSKNPRPAAFIMSQQARLVHQYIVQGMFIYEPKKKKPFQIKN